MSLVVSFFLFLSCMSSPKSTEAVVPLTFFTLDGYKSEHVVLISFGENTQRPKALLFVLILVFNFI